MSWREALRDLVWPTSAPRPAKALADATVPASRDITLNWAWQDARVWTDGTTGGLIPLAGSVWRSYAEIYRTQVWVAVCVNKLAKGVAALPLKSYGTDPNGGRFRLRNAPLATLIARPHPDLPPTLWKQTIVGDLAVYGNAYLLKAGAKSASEIPQALAPLPPYGWRLDEHGDYVLKAPSGDEVTYPRWQLIHLRHWSPRSGGFGMSPLEPLRETLALQDAAQRLSRASYTNGARPSGVLTTDQTLSNETVNRLRENMRQLHGGVDNAYKLAIFEAGLQWQPLAFNLNDSAVVPQRQLAREEVAAAYDLPQSAIGILDHATYSNITEQNRMLGDTYKAWCALIEEGLMLGLADVPEFAGNFVEFDLNALTQATQATRYQAYQSALTAGWLTQNEVRKLENYPAVQQPDADTLHRPLNLTPAAATPAPAGGGA